MFARANAETAAGNAPAAIATLRGIAGNQELDETYRQAALVRQTALEFDTLQPQEVVRRLGPLARAGSAWLGSAGEMVGIAYLKMRRPDLAGPIFAPDRARRERARLDPGARRSDGGLARRRRRRRAGRAHCGRPGRPAPGRAGRTGRNKGKSRMKRLVLALAAVSLLGGCGILGGRDRPTTPTVGQRIPVLGTESQVEVDPLLADVAGHRSRRRSPTPIGRSPAATPPSRWAMSRSAMRRAQAWSVSIGAGNSNRTRLVAEPVVADGRVYTIDTLARVRAFNAETGAHDLGAPGARREQPERDPVRRRRQL